MCLWGVCREIPRLYSPSLRNRGEPSESQDYSRHVGLEEHQGSAEFDKKDDSPRKIPLSIDRERLSILQSPNKGEGFRLDRRVSGSLREA